MLFAHSQSMVQRKRSFVIRLIYSDFKMRIRHRFPLADLWKEDTQTKRPYVYNKYIRPLHLRSVCKGCKDIAAFNYGGRRRSDTAPRGGAAVGVGTGVGGVRIGKIGQSELVDLLSRFAHSLDEFVCGADVFEGFAITIGRYAQLSGFLLGYLEMNRFVVVHPEVSEEDPVCVVLDFGGTSCVACGSIGDRFGGVRTGCE